MTTELVEKTKLFGAEIGEYLVETIKREYTDTTRTSSQIAKEVDRILKSKIQQSLKDKFSIEEIVEWFSCYLKTDLTEHLKKTYNFR